MKKPTSIQKHRTSPNPFSRDPECLPPVGEGFAGPVLIEVHPRRRSGRGRWWRPRGEGYTDVFTNAGVYTAEEGRSICDPLGDEHCYAVDAWAAFLEASAAMDAFRLRLQSVSRGGPDDV